MKGAEAMRQQGSEARTGRRAAVLCALVPTLLALGGCVSFGGGPPPESLLTLSAQISPAAGSGAAAGRETTGRAILVQLPDTPAKLDVLRLPVTINDTQLAYLEKTFWVEKPSRLFRRLIGETLRTRGTALVIDNDDTPILADVTLRGTLLELGYDARTSEVVVQFDAVRTESGGRAISRRFEAREGGVSATNSAVGPALNRAANRVAAEIADWLAE
jgi:cholesterol transport system auxiliary component